MKICVLGAGVIGLTTAWWLSEAGHDIVIVDRNDSTAADASAANGGQLSYAFVAPLASPATLRKLPSLLMAKDGPMRIRLAFDPALISWGARFLLSCRPTVVRETVAAQLALASLSRHEMSSLCQSAELAFGLRTAGKLVVYRTEKEFSAARDAMSAEALGQQALTSAECIALEPALRLDASELAGGIYTASEQVGDCAAFCAELTARLKERSNVAWMLGTQVTDPVISGGRLAAVDTDKGEVVADAFVLCMGAGSHRFAQRCGFYLPVYPLKGISITVPLVDADKSPVSTVLDETYKVAITRLGERIRVGGTAEIAGYDLTLRESRRATLEHSVGDLFPGAGDIGAASFWCGLRPMMPDGPPLVGKSKFANLYFNTGHGTLGWTMACGSARVLSDIVTGRTPEVDPRDLSPQRYGS